MADIDEKTDKVVLAYFHQKIAIFWLEFCKNAGGIPSPKYVKDTLPHCLNHFVIEHLERDELFRPSFHLNEWHAACRMAVPAIPIMTMMEASLPILKETA